MPFNANSTSQVSAPHVRRAASLARWSAAPVLPAPEQCLADVRGGIARATQILTEPSADAMLSAGICLRQAADRLRQLPLSIEKAGASRTVDRTALIAAARAAKEELGHASALFQHAGHFYFHWIRCFSALR